MSELLAPYEIPGTSTHDTAAAARAIRAAAARLGAPRSDVDVALAAVFSTPLTLPDAANSKTDRTLLTPDERLRIRSLLKAGWNQDAIAAEIGCARSTVASLKARGR